MTMEWDRNMATSPDDSLYVPVEMSYSQWWGQLDQFLIN